MLLGPPWRTFGNGAPAPPASTAPYEMVNSTQTHWGEPFRMAGPDNWALTGNSTVKPPTVTTL